MGLFGRRAVPRQRIEPTLPAPEARTAAAGAGVTLATVLGSPRTLSGQRVSTRMAENLSAVMACVNAISSVMSSLPALVYRLGADGREEISTHPVARLVRQPNEAQTWPDLIEWGMAQVLLHGNAVWAIEWDRAGRPLALRPVPWDHVSPVLLPSGRMAYDVSRFVSPWGSTETPRRYLAEDVLHLKDRSDDGLIGRSRISRAPDVLGNAAGIQEFTGSVWRNQATPSGVVTAAEFLTDAQMDQLEASLGKHQGSRNARRVMVLPSGFKFDPVSLSPEDAEVLESRKFSTVEMCRLFQVPPPIVQDYSHNTFTNAQQAALWFAQFTLAPWARKIEAEFARSIFGPSSDCSLEIDLSGLMRGDYATRWQAHEIAVRNNILTPDEVREVEGWGPRPAGHQGPQVAGS